MGLGALCSPGKGRYEQGGKGAPASGKPAQRLKPPLPELSKSLSSAFPQQHPPGPSSPTQSFNQQRPLLARVAGALQSHGVLELHHNLTLETKRWIPSYLCRTSNKQKGRPCNPNSRVLAAPLLCRSQRSHASLWETGFQRSRVSWETIGTHCDHSRSRSHRVPVSREENLLLSESDGLEF